MLFLHSRLFSIAGTLISFAIPLVRGAPTCLSELPCDGSPGALSFTGDIIPSFVKRAVWSPAEGSCWADNVNNQRALEHYVGSFDDLTPAKCQALCDAQGFSLAGVEYSRECYCGNTIIGNNRPSNGICNSPCSGDPNQTCGGGYAINIYVKDNYRYTTGPAALLNAYNGYESPRCWSDSIDNRVFTGYPSPEIPGDQMTVQRCIDGCTAAGFSAAGLEYGRECYCANTDTPPSNAADINECNMPCLGDASQFCGGGNRILVYTKVYYPPPPPSNPNPPNPPPASTTTTTPQPTIITHRGIIQVTNTANNAVIGFISKNSVNNMAQYRYEPNESDAQIVTFQAPLGATSVNQVQLTSTNADTGFPLLGLVQGRDDTNSNISSGSFQYVYFAGTISSDPGATPQTGPNSYTTATGKARTYESSVWTINLSTGAASVQWVNMDGSTPTTYMFVQSTGLYAGGDPAAFLARYPAPVTNIRLTFLPRP